MRMELESFDYRFKKIMAECTRTHRSVSPRELFTHLERYQSRFWTEFSRVSYLVTSWISILSSALNQPVFPQDIQHRIWKNILSRISLDPWMVLDKNSSHGIELLRVVVETIQDSIMALFDFEKSSDQPLFSIEPTPPLVPPPPSHLFSVPQSRSESPVDEEFEYFQQSHQDLPSPTSKISFPVKDSRGIPVRIRRHTTSKKKQHSDHEHDEED